MSVTPKVYPGFGYVPPTDTNGELNDLFLRRFLQTVVVGITGMQAEMVRPRWQADPPNQPSLDTDWAAIGEMHRERDTFAAVLHTTNGDGDGIDTVYRNHILNILCSFYGPNCEANSELFAMGLSLEQNRIAMMQNGFGLVSIEDSLAVPAIYKERWLMGWDTHFRIRRQQIYAYGSPNVETVAGQILTDSELEIGFKINS